MKPLSTFHIIPDLPAPLTPLWDLFHNLWWTWSQDTIRILYQIDPEKWIASGRNPLRFLASLSQQQLDTLADDPTLQEKIKAIADQFEAYTWRPTWYDQFNKNGAMQIAYFSAEFGLAESLPIYSGGLGILAGDHLKAASDLGLPLVGMGLLYRQGYFHQALNPDGWQLEMNPENDFDQMPIRPACYPSGDTVVIDVPYPSGSVKAQVWSVAVGRVTLYLLDTNLETNRPEDREITAVLYGGDTEMRFRQEILLGIGGLRALYALDIQPTICHMNEGHSAFQALERIRILMDEQGLSFGAAREASAAGNIFTTHTPVPAGNDWFPPDLVENYLGSYRATLGLSREEFLGLGRIDPDDRKSDFCMTVLALRLSADSNGVSRLHGEVSRQMWAGLWPDLAESDVPITSITNGIHSTTWVALEMADLFDRYLGEDWRYRPEEARVWDNIRAMPDNELWATHQHRRQRLIKYVRQHLENQFKRHGLPPSKIDQTLSSLNPDALTIGFARRFATYKRGNLVFRTIERLAALFADQQRPLQIFFAGKAHPHDHPGKELIREITHIARQEPFAGKVFFIEDYDMNVARYLVQGCDVWLNNPRRPQEASGTSGMKAALNGVLNISVLDGWWEEACALHPGWAIGGGELYDDHTYQDEVESNALYDLLESEVLPLFYQRDTDNLPLAWIGRMKEAIGVLAANFNTNRMVREYAERLYLPNQRRWQALNADYERTHLLSQWKSHVRAYWSQIEILQVESMPPGQIKVGTHIPLKTTVRLGELEPNDIKVELYMGRVNAQQEIYTPQTLELVYDGPNPEGHHIYSGGFPCLMAGSHGYTLRVIPFHPDLRDPLEMGLVHWAKN